MRIDLNGQLKRKHAGEMESSYRWIDVVAVELLFLHRVKCSTVERQRVSSNDE